MVFDELSFPLRDKVMSTMMSKETASFPIPLPSPVIPSYQTNTPLDPTPHDYHSSLPSSTPINTPPNSPPYDATTIIEPTPYGSLTNSPSLVPDVNPHNPSPSDTTTIPEPTQSTHHMAT